MKNIKGLVEQCKALYSRRVNLIEYLEKHKEHDVSLEDRIALSYDIQAGSYTKDYCNSESIRHAYRESGKKIARFIEEISPGTVLDAGTGEATILANVVPNCTKEDIEFAAFDISISRLLYAKSFLRDKKVRMPRLFTSNLTGISLAENSTDLVMTHHAIEPNGGMEDTICRELNRVTRKYALLIEPSWELACNEQRQRMLHHGYVKNLPVALERNGFNILVNEPWAHDSNPLNVAALILAEKTAVAKDADFGDFQFAYPSSNFLLQKVADGYYCERMGVLFPAVQEIACLLEEECLLATRYLEATANLPANPEAASAAGTPPVRC